MEKKSNYIILLLLLLAFGLRLFDLGGNPPGFFRDEADKGYTSYCLLKTGQDQSGQSWPIFVQALHVTTSSLYQYIDLPFVAVMGLTEKAIRLPAGLAGSLSVLAVFLLAQRWWNRPIAWWAALFVCLSPWSLLPSRWANQSILLTLWIPLAVYFLTKDLPKAPSRNYSIFASFFFLLALYTYAPARLFVPVFCGLAWLCMLNRETFNQENRSHFIRSAMFFWGLFIIGAIPLAYHILYESGESAARFSRISIFHGQPLQAAFYDFAQNYFRHLSPSFLFYEGDANLRHSTLHYGQLHWYLLPLLIVGLIRAVINRSVSDKILLVWFICFPIAAACTNEGIPHALRSVFAVPCVHLLAGNGIAGIIEWLPYIKEKMEASFVKWCKIGWFVLFGFCTLYYISDLYVLYPIETPAAWEYGYRDAITWWQEKRDDYEHTYITGLAEYPYTFFLFYDRYPPEKWIMQQNISGVTFLNRGQSMDSHYQTDKNYLYLVRPQELTNINPEKVILSPPPDRMAFWKWVKSGSN